MCIEGRGNGFGLALGVAGLSDACIVRLTLVPAVMYLMGERMWWMPRWLDRVLPPLNIEPPMREESPARGDAPGG